MSRTYDAGIYNPRTGRIRGSYVYMFLCRDDGPLYVKIGFTNEPMKRLQSLRHGCPVESRQFAFIEVPSQAKAERIEQELLNALKRWAAHGEWLRLELADRAEFNATWREILRLHSTESWPLHWNQVSMSQFGKLIKQRKGYFEFQFGRRARTGGRALEDFQRHQAD